MSNPRHMLLYTLDCVIHILSSGGGVVKYLCVITGSCLCGDTPPLVPCHSLSIRNIILQYDKYILDI